FGGSQGIAALARRNRRRLFKLRARRSLPDKERRQPWAGITAGAQSSDRFEGENQALELWRRSPHARRGHGCSPRRRKADRQSQTSDSTVAVRLVACARRLEFPSRHRPLSPQSYKKRGDYSATAAPPFGATDQSRQTRALRPLGPGAGT